MAQAAQKLEQEAFVPEEEADDEVRSLLYKFVNVTTSKLLNQLIRAKLVH